MTDNESYERESRPGNGEPDIKGITVIVRVAGLCLFF